MAILNVNDYLCLINVTKVLFVRKKNVGFSNGLQWVYAPCSLIKNGHDDGIVEASIFASAKSKATQPLDTINLTEKKLI